MKKLFLIAIILMATLLTVGVNALERPPDEMPAWFAEKTDLQQYDLLKDLANEYIKLDQVINEKNILIGELEQALIYNSDFIKKTWPVKPRFGLSCITSCGVGADKELDLIVNVNFLIGLNSGRLFASIGGYCNAIDRAGGGSIGVGLII